MYVQKELDLRCSAVLTTSLSWGPASRFDNYDNVHAISASVINSDLGLAIGARHITISTCGIVPEDQ
jgi:23S rRNA (adenine2503-C2)-methyltransferase